jgi:glycogen debranching enzyme
MSAAMPQRDPAAPYPLLRSLRDIRSPSGFPYASNGPLFKDGQFGRDSLETAEDLLVLRPDMARAVIHRLAELQGTRDEPRTGEEPGKIHHEYRALVMNGRPIGEKSLAIFRKIAREWHMAETDAELDALTELTNYYTVDATPLYVRLVGRYCAIYGHDILDDRYSPHGSTSGESFTIRHAATEAVGWISRKLETSSIGLLEWDRRTPWEHRFQAWKDGGTSYLHPDGRFANFNGPMASIEVQGLARDALLSALALPLGDGAPDAERLRALADQVQRRTLELFWMPEQQYFAMALDRDPDSGDVRQVRLLTSNAGAVLDSSIMDGLAASDRETYVLPIVERIVGDEFLTIVGIRCTSLLHLHVQPYPAYQSSYTVWHKETYDIAKGLRRQGFPHLAAELERRLLYVVNVAGPREFIYVLPDGRFGPIPRGGGEETVLIRSTNIPENEQAWTIAAALAAKEHVEERLRSGPLPPPGDLERRLLDRAGKTALFDTVAEIVRARHTGYTFVVETRPGWELELDWLREHARDAG